MTKIEALGAMAKGEKVAHEGYSEEEWMKSDGRLGYIFEDDCRCSVKKFWEYRTEDIWNNGWRIVQ